MLFEAKFRQTDQKLNIDIKQNGKVFGTTFRNFQKVTEKPDVEYYAGTYDITPTVDEQSLETKDKYLTENVRIQEIPYFDVGNTAGGSTVYIGTI